MTPRGLFARMGVLFDIALGALVLAAIALTLNVRNGFPLWAATLCLLAVAVGLYALNIRLVFYYIRRRAPEFHNDEMWDLTAGLGVVPRWVSGIGLLAYSPIVAIVIVWIWRWLE